MKNDLAQNLNFSERKSETAHFWKIQNFIKSERFDGFFLNSIPSVLEHWYPHKELFSSHAWKLRQLERLQTLKKFKSS